MGGNDLPEKKQKRKPVLWRNTIAPAYFMFGWNPGVAVKSNMQKKEQEKSVHDDFLMMAGYAIIKMNEGDYG